MATLPKKIEKVPEATVEADVKDMEIEALRAEIEKLNAKIDASPEAKKPVRNLSLDEIAKRTREDLKAYPKVPIFIPFDQSNPHLKVFPIQLNGFTFNVPMGEQYDVPKPIADIWKQSYQADIKASGMMKDGKDPIAEL